MAYKGGHLSGCHIPMFAAGSMEREQRVLALAHVSGCEPCAEAVMNQQIDDLVAGVEVDLGHQGGFPIAQHAGRVLVIL
jgi:hypothetical protein